MNTRIIIPTRNESGNVHRLVGEISQHVPKAQVYFVDDSDTLETVEAIERARGEFPQLGIHYLYRTGSERAGKIVGAVKAGLTLAKLEGIESIVVMDGDGQHNPSDIPKMLDLLRWNDLVSSTRYAPGGSNEGFDNPFRALGSFGATRVAKGLFPKRLADLTDPMTGFFAVKPSRINVDAIEANGFKVLLEIVLSNPGLAISEVPVRFRPRFSGKSKADPAIAAEYLSQLFRQRFTTPSGFFNRREMQLNNV